jgi:hypothetical protein
VEGVIQGEELVLVDPVTVDIDGTLREELAALPVGAGQSRRPQGFEY